MEIEIYLETGRKLKQKKWNREAIGEIEINPEEYNWKSDQYNTRSRIIYAIYKYIDRLACIKDNKFKE